MCVPNNRPELCNQTWDTMSSLIQAPQTIWGNTVGTQWIKDYSKANLDQILKMSPDELNKFTQGQNNNLAQPQKGAQGWIDNYKTDT